MLLTIPAAVSCVVAVVALLAGIAAIAISSGPGWRALRWYGISALGASAYAMCAFATTIDLSPEVRPYVSRLGGFGPFVIIAAWFVHFAATRGRRLVRWERFVVGATCVFAVAWLVPGLCRTSDIFTRTVPWLTVSYTTTRPTALGQLTWLFLFTATALLEVRLAVGWWRGEPGARVDFLSITIYWATAVNDGLCASGRLNMPHLLDSGQFVVVLAVGTRLVARFISDARALERSAKELRAAQSELVRRERLAALGELSAIVAHEVRNPVSVIFNAVSTLRKEVVSPTASTLLNIVNEEADRLKRVAGELLDFARPRELIVHPVSPVDLVRSAVESAVAEIEARQSVAIDTVDDLPDFSGDEQLVRQALINLITNAIQAGGRKSPVRVHAAIDGELIAFEVHDDGDGISSQVAEKMFTPFFTTRASGTGLGLAIVRRIAEAHGGDVTWQRGDHERGVTFTLRVPIKRQA